MTLAAFLETYELADNDFTIQANLPCNGEAEPEEFRLTREEQEEIENVI